MTILFLVKIGRTIVTCEDGTRYFDTATIVCQQEMQFWLNNNCLPWSNHFF